MAVAHLVNSHFHAGITVGAAEVLAIGLLIDRTSPSGNLKLRLTAAGIRIRTEDNHRLGTEDVSSLRTDGPIPAEHIDLGNRWQNRTGVIHTALTGSHNHAGALVEELTRQERIGLVAPPEVPESVNDVSVCGARILRARSLIDYHVLREPEVSENVS